MRLLTIKSLLDDRLKKKLESIFLKLDPSDLDYMASIEKGDTFKVILTFDYDKQDKIEKDLKDLDLLLYSEDLTSDVLRFNYSEDLQDIISDNYYNKKIVEDFILSNLDIDMILDKICISGMK